VVKLIVKLAEHNIVSDAPNTGHLLKLRTVIVHSCSNTCWYRLLYYMHADITAGLHTGLETFTTEEFQVSRGCYGK
jgi:hypothetical protein